MPAMAETPWLRLETPHFRLTGDHAETVRKALPALERFRQALIAFEGQVSVKQADIWLLSKRRDFERTWPQNLSPAPRGVLGHLRTCADQHAIFMHMKSDDRSRVALFHEYAHFYQLSPGKGPFPAWFEEGFAEYYSTLEWTGDRVVAGKPWKVRAPVPRRQWQDFTALLKGDARLLRTARDSAIWYYQSWLLTHWLLSDDTRRSGLNAFLAAGTSDPVSAFERHIAPVTSLPTLLDQHRADLPTRLKRVPDFMPPHSTAIPLTSAQTYNDLSNTLKRTCVI